MSDQNDSSGKPLGVVAFVIIIVVMAVAAAVFGVVGWYFCSLANPMSRRYFEKTETGFVWKFDLAVISIAILSALAAASYACIFGILCMGFFDPKLFSWFYACAWVVIWAVLTLWFCSNRAAMIGIVYGAPEHVSVTDLSARLAGFKSSDEFLIYRRFVSDRTDPTSTVWAELAAAGVEPADIERWAKNYAVNQSDASQITVKTIIQGNT